MTTDNVFIEHQITNAVRSLLTGRVNELLEKSEFVIPLIEFGDNECGSTVAPVITLSTCERTEKERIVRLDAYSMTITFTLHESLESELRCYAYAGAVGRAFYDNPTLDGVVNKAVICGKKYTQPKKPNCGDEWSLSISVRLTVEGADNAG